MFVTDKSHLFIGLSLFFIEFQGSNFKTAKNPYRETSDKRLV